MRTFTTYLLAGLAIGFLTVPASSRLSQPPVAKFAKAGVEHSALDHCTSRPLKEDGCGQCAHFLANRIVQDESAWLLAIYAQRGHMILNRKLRGRPRRSKPRQLPHQYFVHVMEEALKAIAEVEPGARVNIAIFSEGHVGATVDEHGEPVSWKVVHELCVHEGLNCLKVRELRWQS